MTLLKITDSIDVAKHCNDGQLRAGKGITMHCNDGQLRAGKGIKENNTDANSEEKIDTKKFTKVA